MHEHHINDYVKHLILNIFCSNVVKTQIHETSKFVISESLNLHVVEMGRLEEVMCSSWVLRSLTPNQTQSTYNGLGLIHTREQCFYKQQMQTWLGLFHL
jgi:hypothetical protein